MEMLNSTKDKKVVAAVPDSSRGIVKPPYESNSNSRYLAHKYKGSPTYSASNKTLEDTSPRQQAPFSDYTMLRPKSYDYLTLQMSFKCNLVFPDFLPLNTMWELLELEELLFKFADHQAVSPQITLQIAVDQCKRGDNGFLISKLNQLRYMDSLKH
jgi:hypothetical protein